VSYRAVFCGSRNWDDPAPIFSKLNDVLERHPDLVVVHGAGRGADLITDALCEWMGIPVDPHPADWVGKGPSAGPKRNQQMLDSGIEAVYAFKAGFCRSMDGGGTEDMVRRSLEAFVPAMVIEHSNPALPQPAIHLAKDRTDSGITTPCGLVRQHTSTTTPFASAVTCEECLP
jgi:hypothetical protein